MKLSKAAQVLPRCELFHLTTPLAHETKARCRNKYPCRRISTTTSRAKLRIPIPSKSPLESITPSTQKSQNQEENKDPPVDSWGSLLQGGRGVENSAMSSLFGTWYSPTPDAPFPYSRHPSRNSSTTPRPAQPMAASSDLIFDATRRQRQYANHTNWGHMVTDIESPTLSIIKNMTAVVKPKKMRQPMIFNPSSGRSVIVTETTDVALAFKRVEMSCSRNRIRREANAQRFHERPGLKRKRLKSQRWRQRFLDGFKATISRVQDLWRQGW